MDDLHCPQRLWLFCAAAEAVSTAKEREERLTIVSQVSGKKTSNKSGSQLLGVPSQRRQLRVLYSFTGRSTGNRALARNWGMPLLYYYFSTLLARSPSWRLPPAPKTPLVARLPDTRESTNVFPVLFSRFAWLMASSACRPGGPIWIIWTMHTDVSRSGPPRRPRGRLQTDLPAWLIFDVRLSLIGTGEWAALTRARHSVDNPRG